MPHLADAQASGLWYDRDRTGHRAGTSGCAAASLWL